MAAAAILMLPFTANAFKKGTGADQYFRSNFKGIIKRLPTVCSAGQTAPMLLHMKDGKRVLIDCKTGNETEFKEEATAKDGGAQTCWSV